MWDGSLSSHRLALRLQNLGFSDFVTRIFCDSVACIFLILLTIFSQVEVGRFSVEADAVWDALSQRLSGARGSSLASPSCGPVSSPGQPEHFQHLLHLLHLLFTVFNSQFHYLQNIAFYKVLFGNSDRSSIHYKSVNQ